MIAYGRVSLKFDAPTSTCKDLDMTDFLHITDFFRSYGPKIHITSPAARHAINFAQSNRLHYCDAHSSSDSGKVYHHLNDEVKIVLCLSDVLESKGF
jgi:hypothetical protein